MYAPDLPQRIIRRFPAVTEMPVPEKTVRSPAPQALVPAASLRAVCLFLRDDPKLAFTLPVYMTAVDHINDGVFELVYALYSIGNRKFVMLKVRIPREDAEVDSVADIWNGMDWQEREVLDLFGIRFRGHPNPKRIMLWEGYPGHPLRKDYVHVTDRFDSGLEIGTPGLDAKGVPLTGEARS